MRVVTTLSASLAAVAVGVAAVGCGANDSADRAATYVGFSREATLMLVGPTSKHDVTVWDLSLRFTPAGAAVRRKAVRVGNPASSAVELFPRLSVFCLSDQGLWDTGIRAADLDKVPLIVHFAVPAKASSDRPKAGHWICGLRDARTAQDRPGESRAAYLAKSLLAVKLTRR